jgi:hypothetical protein
MPHPRRSLLAVLTAALLLALTAGPTVAAQRHTAARPGPGTFGPIVGKLDGRTGADLLADSFLADYRGPSSPPSGDCPRLGRHHRVVWVGQAPSCHVRAGEAVVALIGAACSDVEPPPFFAVGEAAQRACAQANNAAILSITVAVDGGAPAEIIRRALAVSPPQRHIVIPASNPAGFPSGPATFTADGWAAALQPVTPGTHTLNVVGTFDGLDQPIEEAFTLVVAPRNHSPLF